MLLYSLVRCGIELRRNQNTTKTKDGKNKKNKEDEGFSDSMQSDG